MKYTHLKFLSLKNKWMSENTSVSCVRYCAHSQYWNPDVVQWGWAQFCSVWLSLVLATWPQPTGMHAVAQCPECYWRDAQVRLHSVNHSPEGSAGHIETAGERGRECVIILCYKVSDLNDHKSHKSTINATVKMSTRKYNYCKLLLWTYFNDIIRYLHRLYKDDANVFISRFLHR